MKNSSNIYKCLTALLLASMCANEAAAQMNETGLPKLVVNITIDQLRSDYALTNGGGDVYENH